MKAVRLVPNREYNFYWYMKLTVNLTQSSPNALG